MSYPATAETTVYRGCTLIVCQRDILVIAPDGDIACFYQMSRVRLWIRRKLRTLEAEGGGRKKQLASMG